MAGQNSYKGSNSFGVRSLSLSKWRESFVVSGINILENNVTHCTSKFVHNSSAGFVVFQWASPRKEWSTHPPSTTSRQDLPTLKQVRRGLLFQSHIVCGALHLGLSTGCLTHADFLQWYNNLRTEVLIRWFDVKNIKGSRPGLSWKGYILLDI